MASSRALDDITLSVDKGEILALVGESGCGKSVTAMTVMGLLPRHSARILSGSVQLSGEELIGASEKTMRQIRGGRIGMVFQDPMSSLNPVHTIGLQISEAVREHWQWDWNKSMQRAKDMLDFVRIPDAVNRLSSYPHRTVRRHEAKGDDCHGTGVRSRAAHRRRADNGP